VSRFLEYVPHWLAWPAGALSTLAALGASALLFHAATFAEVSSAVWGGVVFVGAAALWWVADVAAGNRPL
jgi:hypothetical protein